MRITQSDSLIKRFFHVLILLPSFFCLDAAFVALGWSQFLARERSGDRLLSQALDLTIRDAALFLCVWIIYLFDRLYDSRKLLQAEPGIREAAPLRHQFAIRHPGLMRGLLLVGVLLLFSLFILFENSDWILGFTAGAGVVSYFVLFRFAQRMGRIDKVISHFPAKEVSLAVFFSIGVVGAADRFEDGSFSFAQNLLTGIAFFLLVLSNCLLIASSERQFDQIHDSASYYSNSERSIMPVLLSLSGFTVITAFLLGLGWQEWSLCLVILTTTFGLLLIHFSSIPEKFRQPAFDAVLLIPWISILFA